MNRGHSVPTTPNGHLHAEAYYLMTYADAEGNIETVWNSRDGVTPFVMYTRDGKEAQHVNFRAAKYDIYHVPQVGDRVWASMTWERAKEYAAKRIEKMKEHYGNGFDERYPLPEQELFLEIAENIYDNGRAPMILEVTEEIHIMFKVRAKRLGSLSQLLGRRV